MSLCELVVSRDVQHPFAAAAARIERSAGFAKPDL